MKVILLKELKGRGGEGDVVDVAQGYAVNYLLPQGIAIEATKGELKQLEDMPSPDVAHPAIVFTKMVQKENLVPYDEAEAVNLFQHTR